MIEQSLYSVLSSVASGRVYPLIAPDNVEKPYIIFQVVSAMPENTLADGVGITNFRMQIDCYDKTYAGVKTLAESVKTAMSNASFTNLQLMGQDFFESDVKLYRVSMDFSIWAD